MKAHSPILREFTLTERKRGAKISEIAVRLKLPSGTVKAWLFRGNATSHATITTGAKHTSMQPAMQPASGCSHFTTIPRTLS